MSLSSRRTKHLALTIVYMFVVYTFGAFSAPLCAAQIPKATEYEVKAAYLYNFGKFVTWPSNGSAGGSDDFVICVLGQDPFGANLQTTVAGEKVGVSRSPRSASPRKRMEAIAGLFSSALRNSRG